jgi:hypothetical protein
VQDHVAPDRRHDRQALRSLGVGHEDEAIPLHRGELGELTGLLRKAVQDGLTHAREAQAVGHAERQRDQSQRQLEPVTIANSNHVSACDEGREQARRDALFDAERLAELGDTHARLGLGKVLERLERALDREDGNACCLRQLHCQDMIGGSPQL